LADERWRGGTWRDTFGLFTETWFEACRRSPLTWLGVVKRCGDPRNQGRSTPHQIPGFGILERHGRVPVTVVRDGSADSLLREPVRTVKRGSLVDTDRWQGYETLAVCGDRHLRVDHGTRVSRPRASGKVPINGLAGFGSDAKGTLRKPPGGSPRRFPRSRYDAQVRYNHRTTTGTRISSIPCSQSSGSRCQIFDNRLHGFHGDDDQLQASAAFAASAASSFHVLDFHRPNCWPRLEDSPSRIFAPGISKSRDRCSNR
jgi:hypothetical protein